MKQMRDKVFIDTNIVVYLYSSDELVKKDRVEKIIDSHSNIFISTQVINEFINVMHKKRSISLEHIAKAIQELTNYVEIATITTSTIHQALSIAKYYKYSYFDSLIIASALEHQCSLLYTEDMHHQQIIENSLQIINPFSG